MGDPQKTLLCTWRTRIQSKRSAVHGPHAYNLKAHPTDARPEYHPLGAFRCDP